MQDILEFSDLVKREFPSLIGVVPPLLRLHGAPYEVDETKEDKEQFRLDCIDYIRNFKYNGVYHTTDHFEQVAIRITEMLGSLSSKFPEEFPLEDIEIYVLWALTHDMDHWGYKKEEATFLSVESIARAYGLDSNDINVLTDIKNALNFGIAEDNKMTGGARPMITTLSDDIALSEEEITSIRRDAFAFRNNVGRYERMIYPGMDQATEFGRSMKDGKPAFKWPRTQREVVGKLADLGNFCESIEQWVHTSTLINVEVPWFTGKTVLDFIQEELDFIDNMLMPILDLENLPTIKIEDGVRIKARIPDFFLTCVNEKRDYLESLAMEIQVHAVNGDLENPAAWSDRLKWLSEAVRPALAKNDPNLADAEVVPGLAGGAYVEGLMGELKQVLGGLGNSQPDFC